MKELRLRLKGTQVVFPDGKAICLVCGAPPSGVRRVWFENPDPTPSLTKADGLVKGISAIAGRLSFDAPLCKPHHRRAWSYAFKAVGLGLLGVALLIGGIALLPAPSGRGGKDDWKLWLAFLPALVPWGFAYFAWQKKDRGGLDCEASREGADLVLRYPDRP